MKFLNNTVGHPVQALMIIAVLGILVPVITNAQGWQYVYGSDTDYEWGRFRVTPVGACGNLPAGYVAVGASLTGTNIDSRLTYVVRTDLTGAPIWDATFDIGNDGLPDYAHSVAVGLDGTGQQIVTVVGSARVGEFIPNWDTYLLQIDCDGAIRWVNVYGGLDDEFGYEVIQAVNGDFIVAGGSGTGNCPGFVAKNHAWLFRTDNAGNLLWDRQYSEGDYKSAFVSLTEVVTCPMMTHDIIAVGWREGDNYPVDGLDGYIVRVDAATGTIIPTSSPPQNSAIFGGPGDQIFYSVIELENPNLTDPISGCHDVVVSGESQDPNGNVDIYTVRLQGGDPCLPVAQSLIGDPGVAPPAARRDWARTIREVTAPPVDPQQCNAVAQWDLILTGASNYGNTVTNDLDVILLSVLPTTLVPGGLGMRYNAGLTGHNDEGWSVAPTYSGGLFSGAIICGETRGDPVSVLDPGDMYLINAFCNGVAGGDQCDELYSPTSAPGLPWACKVPTYCQIDQWSPVDYEVWEHDWDDPICPLLPPPNKLAYRRDGSTTAGDMLSSESGWVRYHPNPVRHGEGVLMAVGSLMDSDVRVTIFSIAGEQLQSFVIKANSATTAFRITTDELAAGVYFMEVSDGVKHEAVRVVVVE